jgi:hypothetical protein
VGEAERSTFAKPGRAVRVAIGAPKKTSGRSYSPERPVARHFVWAMYKHLACRPQTIQNTGREDF